MTPKHEDKWMMAYTNFMVIVRSMSNEELF